MGCRFSVTSGKYQRDNIKPSKSVSLRTAIRRRESFVHASTILIGRVARRTHHEWRESRRLTKKIDNIDRQAHRDFTTDESTATTRASVKSHHSSSYSVESIPEETALTKKASELEYEPFYEHVGETRVNVASMDWDALPETLKNVRTNRCKIVVEAVIEELRKSNEIAELEIQKLKSKKQRPSFNKFRKKRGEIVRHTLQTDQDVDDKNFENLRRKSINLSMTTVDKIAKFEYDSCSKHVDASSGNDDESWMPWHALTSEERVARYRRTLCAISEWNMMMVEAETPITAFSPYTVHNSVHDESPAARTPLHSRNSSPASESNMSVFSCGSAESKSHRLNVATIRSSSSVSPISEPSPLAASAAFSRNVPFGLVSGSHEARAGGQSRQFSASSRNLKRVLSGRDVLQEIRQTIRITSNDRLDANANAKTNRGGKTRAEGRSNSSVRSRMRWAALRVVETTRAHLRKQIRRNKNFVRVFVSSTFRDFHVERDYLFQRVFPKLESACAQRGILFIPVDLRWGVTEEEALDGEVLKLCLQEVDMCRPFFVAMLGERYGWHITPDSDKNNESANLLNKTFDVAAMTFPWVNKWRDRSATEIEIRHAVLNNPGSKMRSFFYFRDPSSKEICGDDSNKDVYEPESKHAKALQDQLKDNIRKVESSDHKIFDGYRTLEELGKAMYSQLKEAIDFHARRQSLESVATTAMNQAASMATDAISPSMTSRDQTEMQVVNHNAAVEKALTHSYAKNQELFTRIEEFCGKDSGNTPLVIVGTSGSGKSALLANLSESRAPQLRNTLCVILYIGTQSQNPTISEVIIDLLHLVRRSLQQLSQRIRGSNRPTKSQTSAQVSSGTTPSHNVKKKVGGLRRQASTGALLATGASMQSARMEFSEGDAMESPLDIFSKILEEAGHEAKKCGRRLLIGLDGVDRVHDNSVSPLAWIPVATPSNVQMLITLGTGEKALESSFNTAAIGESQHSVDEDKVQSAQGTLDREFSKGVDKKKGLDDEKCDKKESPLHEKSLPKLDEQIVLDKENMENSEETTQAPKNDVPRQTQLTPHVVLGRRITRMLKAIRDRKWHVIEVSPLSREEQRHLVSTFLNLYGKKFSQEQMSLVLGNSGMKSRTANPLYLVTVLNEIRKFGSFENLGSRLKQYLESKNIIELFAQVLLRLDEEIGRNGAVRCAARVIWVSQSGVSEDDLRSILKISCNLRTDEDFDEFRHRTRDVFVNRANLVSFVHDSLAAAVEEICLAQNGIEDTMKARKLLIHALEHQLSESSKAQRLLYKEAVGDKQKDNMPKKARSSLFNLRGDGWWYQMRELAYQYSMLEKWDKLSGIIGKIQNFSIFSEFDPELLIRYWRLLRLQHIRPDQVYADYLQEYVRNVADDSCQQLEPAHGVTEGELSKMDSFKESEGEEKANGGKRLKYAHVVQRRGRRASNTPGRRRSLIGIDLELLLSEPLSSAGKIIVHEYGMKLKLELELEMIDAERQILLGLVRFFQMMGEFRVALKHAKVALEIMESMPRAFFGVVEVSSMMMEIALLEHKLHDFDHAMPHLVRANEMIFDFLKSHPEDVEVRRMHIVVLGDMANLLRETGRFDEALTKYDEALIWTTRYLGAGDVECAVHLNNLANLLMEEQRNQEALFKYEQSLKITRDHYGEEHPEVARTLHNIGLCLKRLGNYSDAMDHFMAAVKMMVDALGTYHPEVGTVLNNVSILYSLRARQVSVNTEEARRKRRALYLKAQQAAERSVVIRERTLGSDHPTLAGAYTNLGKIYMLTGNIHISEQCYSRAVEIAQGRLGENHPLVGRGLAQLGKLATRKGELETARDRFKKAIRVLKVVNTFGAFTTKVERSLVQVEKKIVASEVKNQSECV